MKRKYNWEEWFKRPRFTLFRDIDYQCSQSTMAQMVRNSASLRGLRVRVIDAGAYLTVNVMGRRDRALPRPNEVAVAG